MSTRSAEVNYHIMLRTRAEEKLNECKRSLDECKRSLDEYKRKLDECEKREAVGKVATLVASSTGEELPVEVEKNINEFLGGRKKRSKRGKKSKGRKTKKRKSQKRRKRKRSRKRKKRKHK